VIKHLLDIHVAATGRIFQNRAETVGASDIGQCIRKVAFDKLGHEPDRDYADNWGAGVRGGLIENHLWEPALRRYFGGRLVLAGADQTTLRSGFLSATPDGMVTNMPRGALAHLGVEDIGSSRCVVLECKSIDPRANLDEVKPEHFYQVQVQLGLIRKRTQHCPEWAIVSYINASFLDDVTEFAVRFDPKIFAAAEARAQAIMAAASPTDLPPEGAIAGGSECEYCPFARSCGRLRRAVPFGVAETKDEAFDQQVATLARLAKEQRHEAEATATALRQTEHSIKELMRKRGIRRVDHEDVQVTWTAVKGRGSYDIPAIKQAAEQAGIDLSQFEQTGDQTDRLVVSIRAAIAA
jgi:hypothetical protein